MCRRTMYFLCVYVLWLCVCVWVCVRKAAIIEPVCVECVCFVCALFLFFFRKLLFGYNTVNIAFFHQSFWKAIELKVRIDRIADIKL